MSTLKLPFKTELVEMETGKKIKMNKIEFEE